MKAIHRALLATVSGLALSVGASAADMPMKSPPVRVAAAPSWTGPYIGINGGVAWNKANFRDVGDSSTPTQFSYFGSTSFWIPREAGGTIGGQFGYNWQFGNVVYGLEADLNWVGSKTNAVIQSFVPIAASTSLDWFATVRGRFGFALSSTLVYVTGGLAIGHFKDAWGGGSYAPAPEFIGDETRAGWTVGGGIEHMLTRNWTVKVEGLYADFGNWTVNGPQGVVGPYRSRFAHSVTMARGGLNWKW